jgi:hypothetical protein
MTQTVVPVELSLSRDLLVRLVTANIAALHRHSEIMGDVGGVVGRATAGVLRDQEAFLEWVVRQPDPFVCVSIFAADAAAEAAPRRRRRKAA